MPSPYESSTALTPEERARYERARARLGKDQPGPSDVHVPGTQWDRRGRPKRRGLLKADEDRHLVTGFASVITESDGRPVIDAQGDVITEDDLLKTAHDFIASSRTTGDSHLVIEGVGKVVETVVFTSDLKKALGIEDRVPTGWLVTAKIDNPDVWARVKRGELAGFSIGGSGVREPWVAKAHFGPRGTADADVPIVVARRLDPDLPAPRIVAQRGEALLVMSKDYPIAVALTPLAAGAVRKEAAHVLAILAQGGWGEVTAPVAVQAQALALLR